MPTLHVVIPVYNERKTLEDCLRRVKGVQLPEDWQLSIQVVDDHSDEDGFRIVKNVVEKMRGEGLAIALHRHDINQGKGAALQTGFDQILATDPPENDLVIIQDADLEYDPDDYPLLMEPLTSGQFDAVVGTRWGTHLKLEGLKRKIHAWGNGSLTLLSNLMTGYRVSDMECCYKVFSVRVLQALRPMLTEKRFGIEPQMIASLSRLKARVTEVPIAYDPRGLSAGKKIGWKDGVCAIWVITRERLRKRPSKTLAHHPEQSKNNSPPDSARE